MHRARRVQSGKTRQICPAYQAAPAVRPVAEPMPAPASRRWRMINRLESSRLRGSGPVRPTNRQEPSVCAVAVDTGVGGGSGEPEDRTAASLLHRGDLRPAGGWSPRAAPASELLPRPDSGPGGGRRRRGEPPPAARRLGLARIGLRCGGKVRRCAGAV